MRKSLCCCNARSKKSLRCFDIKIEELNRNTVRLIAEAEKLIQDSKQLSARIKSFENSATKPKWSPSAHY